MRDIVYYTTSEALDQINDALNLNYCRPKNDYSTTAVFKDSFNIAYSPVNGISETDLLSLCNQAAIAAGDHYYAISDSTKAPFTFEVVQADNPANNNIPLYVYFTMTKGACSSSVTYPYASTEARKFGWNYGTCTDVGDGFDAADIFRCDLRKNKAYKNTHASYYFTDRYSVCFGQEYCHSYEIPFIEPDLTEGPLSNPNDSQSGDNAFDYLLFSSNQNLNNFHLCLNSEELNFYYLSSANLIDTYKPSGKVVGNVEYGYNWTSSEFATYFQTMRVDYNKVNIITGTSNQTQMPCTGCNP